MTYSARGSMRRTRARRRRPSDDGSASWVPPSAPEFTVGAAASKRLGAGVATRSGQLFGGRARRHRLRQRGRPFADADLALRRGQLDPVLTEAVPEREIDFAGHVLDPVRRVLD